MVRLTERIFLVKASLLVMGFASLSVSVATAQTLEKCIQAAVPFVSAGDYQYALINYFIPCENSLQFEQASRRIQERFQFEYWDCLQRWATVTKDPKERDRNYVKASEIADKYVAWHIRLSDSERSDLPVENRERIYAMVCYVVDCAFQMTQLPPGSGTPERLAAAKRVLLKLRTLGFSHPELFSFDSLDRFRTYLSTYALEKAGDPVAGNALYASDSDYRESWDCFESILENADIARRVPRAYLDIRKAESRKIRGV